MAFGFPKPARGTSYLEARDRRADRRDAEQAEMQAALVRDRRRCRWPGCTGKHRGLDLPIDPCHEKHRGIGGNPKGDRTTRDQLVALCRKHHGEWDTCMIDLRPLTGEGFDNIVAFYEQDAESGLMKHIASETMIGVSEPRR